MLRFGIICRDTTLAAWQMRTIEHLRATDDVRAALLILDERGASPREHESAMWKWYSSFSRTGRIASSVEAWPGDVPILHCARDASGQVRDEEIAAIRARNLDFILDFGPGPIPGAIAHLPRYGVWSFVLDGNDKKDHSPPCFWAIYTGTPAIAAMLHRRGGDGDNDTVLRRGHFKNFTHSYRQTLEQIEVGIARWPAQVCEEIRRGVTDHASTAAATPISPRAAPTNLQVIVFLLRLSWRFARIVWAKLSLHDQWNIGIVAAPIETFLVAGARPPVRWLPRPERNHFLADPFPSDDTALFVEEFDYHTGKGTIAMLTMADGGTYSAPRTVIESSVHLSYPYLIHYQGDVYCVPESGEAGEIALYKATAYPNQWTKCMTLIAGFAGLDATLFPHDGRWWLLCTEQGIFADVMLHAWHAPDLFGPWTPHAGNPVKTDVRSSRPAGRPFVHRGQLYRPAQDCSRTYGGAVAINRVLRLSPTAFDEETVAVVEPYADSPYRYGLHTLSAFDQFTVIDGKGRTFAPAELRRILSTFLRGAARRVSRRA
ncbi:MAG TPA: hypothetical protein VIG44_14460 [Thermomicrobiales bacterium]